PAAIPPLVKQLKSAELPIDPPASGVLGLIGPDAVAPLLGLTSNPKAHIRAGVLRALGQIGPAARKAVPAMITGLEDRDVFVRVAAAQGLMMIGPDGRDAVPALLKALKDMELTVRQHALMALERFRLDVKALPALKEAARAEDVFTRGKAIELCWRVDQNSKAALTGLTEMLKGQ